MDATNYTDRSAQTDSRFIQSAFMENSSEQKDFCKLLSLDSLDSINSAVREHTSRHGKTLPEVTLENTGEDPVSLASYRLGEGKLNLMGGKPGDPEFLAAVAHELKHAEQDLLMLWYLCDKHGLGKSATAEEKQLINSEYGSMTSTNASEDFLAQVIAIRDGRSLDKESGKKAEKLLASIKEERSSNSPLAELDGARQFLADLYQFQTTNGMEATLNKLVELSKLEEPLKEFYGHAVFGNGTLTAERIEEHFGDPSKESWNRETSTNKFRAQILKQDQVLLKEMNKAYEVYANRFHEAEAFQAESRFKGACLEK